MHDLLTNPNNMLTDDPQFVVKIAASYADAVIEEAEEWLNVDKTMEGAEE